MTEYLIRLLGATIPVSFDLATGPFRVFGFDVKKAYDMAKKLYKVLKDLKAAAEIIADLAELAGFAEAAGDVLAGVSNSLYSFRLPALVIVGCRDEAMCTTSRLDSWASLQHFNSFMTSEVARLYD